MGENLIQEIVLATGLPPQMITEELLALINKSGKSPAQITLDDVRLLLADLLQETLIHIKQELDQL